MEELLTIKDAKWGKTVLIDSNAEELTQNSEDVQPTQTEHTFEEQPEDNSWSFTKMMGVGVGIVGGTIGVVAATPIVMGFGVGGIVAGSSAAVMQAGIGNVVAGSAFAIVQSLGMTGTLAATAAAGSAVGAIGVGVAIKSE